MIRLAELSDLEQVVQIVKVVRLEMQREGNEQWGEDYPLAVNFMNDIEKRELYINEVNGLVGGFLCINHDQPEEYAQINWSGNERPIVLHRMAVAPDFQRRGIASMLCRFAEEFAQSSGINYIRSDTNSFNVKMNALFQKSGYNFVGQMPAFGKKSLFNFYDKVLVFKP
jgi:GNAT superfamily N-acetyltransferase